MNAERVGIVGAGTMGRGIAQVTACAGLDVWICDAVSGVLTDAMDTITRRLSRDVERKILTEEQKQDALSRIRLVEGIQDLAGVDVVIEAVTENLEVKQSVFKELDEICQSDAILVSNTSALSITALAAVTKRPGKVAGMHFFNPAYRMELVEIVRGVDTSDETVETIRRLAERMGKTPILIPETPGHLVDRILAPMINEAMFALMEGVASAEEIDKAMKLGAHHPMGPLELADLVGLDVVLAMLETLHGEFGDDKYRPCPILRKLVRAGRLGRKTGRGVFDYKR